MSGTEHHFPIRGLDHFAFAAPVYERFFQTASDEQVLTFLALPTPGLLLDVGGGTGRISGPLAALTGGVVVVDVSASMLRYSIRKGLHPLLGAAERLPMAAESVERLLAVDSFHHFRNQKRAAAEFMRLLKPGGRLVIEEPNIRSFPVKLIALGETLALMRSKFYPVEQIAAMFQAHGGVTQVHENKHIAWVVVDKPAQ